jgi:hypothetical protein
MSLYDGLIEIDKHFRPIAKDNGLPVDLTLLCDEIAYNYEVLGGDINKMSRQIAALTYSMWRLHTNRTNRPFDMKTKKSNQEEE